MLQQLLFLSSFLISLCAGFSATGKNNVAVYWGQNSAQNQQNLAYYCQQDTVDIVILSFVVIFPGVDNIPSLNFANACYETYSNGILHCSSIGNDIKTCQNNGKKVLLSLGGASGSYLFSSDSQAESFAESMWNLFGEGTSNTRPFDDSVVDGFDLDIENNLPAGYPAFVAKLRQLYATGKKDYYISAAPQCPIPDASLNNVLTNAQVDFAFIQFYNNYCKIGNNFNWNDWANWANSDAYNKNIKLYLGLPGSPAAAGSGYVDADTAKSTIQSISGNSHFGGVAIWDASQAYANVANGQNFAQSIKSILNGISGDNSSPTTSSSTTTQATTSSTPTTSSTSTTSSSSTTTSTITSASSIAASTSTSSSSVLPTTQSTVITSKIITTITSGSSTFTSDFTLTSTSASTLIVSTTSAAATSTGGSSSDESCTGKVGLPLAQCLNKNFNTDYYYKSGCTDGDYICRPDGKIAHCDHSNWVSFECAPGTTCFASNLGDSVQLSCNFISQKSIFV